MAVCTDREDAVSMALSAVQGLLEKYNVDPMAIGRLECATESSVDRSKSIKSHLMTLFTPYGNTNIEGVDCVHACYGGTAAVLAAAAWVESSSWDGRLAVVAATDLALYQPGSAANEGVDARGWMRGPARGSGCVALLVGPNAPLALIPGWRATYAAHAQEFCKPVGREPSPVFDGPATVHRFLNTAEGSRSQCIVPLADHIISHAPFHKLVQKLCARLCYQDVIRANQRTAQGSISNTGSAPMSDLINFLSPKRFSMDPDNLPSTSLAQPTPPQHAAQGRISKTGSTPLSELTNSLSPKWISVDPDNLPPGSLASRELEQLLMASTYHAYVYSRFRSGATAQQRVGNVYTASVWLGLASLMDQEGAGLEEKRVLCIVRSECDQAHKLCASAYGAAPYTPQGDLSPLRIGTYYLVSVDDKHHRHYVRKMSSCDTDEEQGREKRAKAEEPSAAPLCAKD
eukprot:gene26855-4458_t